MHRCAVYENLLLQGSQHVCICAHWVKGQNFSCSLLSTVRSVLSRYSSLSPVIFFFAFFSYLQLHFLRVRFHALIKRTDLRGLFLICLNAATLFTGTYLQTNRRLFFFFYETPGWAASMQISAISFFTPYISLTLAKCYRHVGVRADRKHVGFIWIFLQNRWKMSAWHRLLPVSWLSKKNEWRRSRKWYQEMK